MEILSRNDCINILKRYNPHLKLLDYRITKFCDQVLGFFGEHYSLQITYADKITPFEEKCQRFFLKSLPYGNPAQSEYLKALDVFAKEIAVYGNLINEFLKLTSSNFAPKYYFNNGKCIVLEDVSTKGFQVMRWGCLNPKSTKSALRALATFHAASIILEDGRSTQNESFRIIEHYSLEVLEKTFAFNKNEPRYLWLVNAIRCLKDLSRYFSKSDKVSKTLDDFLFSEDGFRKYLKPSSKFRNVLCHDDLWCNNIMFNDNDDCVLVDFQMTKYSPPVSDVLLFLYLNVEKNELENKLHEYLQLYYDCLKTELSCHQININNIIPDEDFWESVKMYKLPALVKSALYGTNVYIPKELSKVITSDIESFQKFYLEDRSYFILNEFNNNPEFRQRFSQVLIPLYEMFELI